MGKNENDIKMVKNQITGKGIEDAILLVSFGSRYPSTKNELKKMAQTIMKMGNFPLVEIAFTSKGKPDFFEGVLTCINKGARKIIIHPYFLYRGRMVKEYIPDNIWEAQQKYPDIKFFITEPIRVHEDIAKVVIERIKDAKPFKKKRQIISEKKKEAILLFGHGSPFSSANNEFKEMAQMIMKRGNFLLVEIAFIEFERPDFFEGVARCIAKGFKKIIIQPYFLTGGMHVRKELSEMVEKALQKYPDIEFYISKPLGVHENIANVIIERINNAKPFKILMPDEIEEKSMEIIAKEMGETNFKEKELPIVKRAIHATGDFEYAKNIRFHPEAVSAGIRAIKKGMNILVDVKMVEAGINKNILKQYGGKVICYLSEPWVKEKSEATGKTRSSIAIEMGAKENIGIVAIGNAPTALYTVMKLIERRKFRPELVIGVPVGFVNAVESKEVLFHKDYPFITSLGRKGGSSVAVAIINALLKISEKMKTK